MTLISLGYVALRDGMTKFEAKQADEQIRLNNHGKTPVDKNGKSLQTNVGLFEMYDKNKDGIIGNDEYQKYRNDIKEKFKSMLKDNKNNIQDIFNTLKNRPQSKYHIM